MRCDAMRAQTHGVVHGLLHGCSRRFGVRRPRGSYAKVYHARWPTWIVLTHAGPLLIRDGAAPAEWRPLDVPSLRALEEPQTTSKLDELMACAAVCEQARMRTLSRPNVHAVVLCACVVMCSCR
jgi:hypothetical protein